MKTYVSLFVLMMPCFLCAQSQIWQVPVVKQNVQLELPEAVVLDSIIVNIPDTGNVFVRFEGNCIASPSDLIVLAASHYENWVTNDGNTWVLGYDSIRTNQCFNHTRIYPVNPGTYTWYAIGHNWVFNNGNGIASINGRLVVEYVPSESEDLLLTGEGMIESIFLWQNNVKVFKQITVEAPVKGKILVNWDGLISLLPQDTAYLVTNLSTSWPGNEEAGLVYMSDQHDSAPFVHRKIYEVDPGTYEIYALGLKTAGDPDNTNNAMYGTLTAQFIPDAVPQSAMVSEMVETSTLMPGEHRRISLVEIMAPESGMVWVQLTGVLNSSLDDRVSFTIEYAGPEDPVVSHVLVQSVLQEKPFTYFTLSGYVYVEEGLQEFEVYADFDPASSGTGVVDVKGLVTAQFFPEPMSTATGDVIADDSQMTFYPNPTTGLIYGRSEEEVKNGHYKITVSDATGRQVMVKHGDINSDISANLGHLLEGMYQVRFESGAYSESHMIYKMNHNN